MAYTPPGCSNRLESWGNSHAVRNDTMKTKTFLVAAISLLISAQCGVAEELGTLQSNFKNPGKEYGVNCWWWWLNGNVTKEAITKDLEAMKSKDFQGAMVFDAGGHNQRGNGDIPAGPLFGSDAWNELFVYALDEARRLELEIGFNIQSGWNLGGPGVTPQYAAKQLVFSEARIVGGGAISQPLQQPKSRKGFYEDIVVLAFPMDASKKTTDVITNLDYKLGYHELASVGITSTLVLQSSVLMTPSRRPTVR